MAKKTSNAFSHSTLAVGLLIALVAILVLLVGQVQNKQTTGSEAQELKRCDVDLESVTLLPLDPFDFTCKAGSSHKAIIKCDDGYTETVSIGGSCYTKAQWETRGQEICNARWNVIECGPQATVTPDPNFGGFLITITPTPYYRYKDIPIPTQNPY